MTARKSVQFGSFILDLDRLCLLGPSGQADLRRKSFDVLRYLVEHAGHVVTKEELIGAVWPDVTVGDESVTQCISEVRRALGDQDHRVVKTVARRGYLLEAMVSIRDSTSHDVLGEALPPFPELHHRSVAVLPFTNFGADIEQQYIADGIVEDIITELSRFRDLLVIARTSSYSYRGKSVDIRQIGRDLGVRYVMEGSFRRDGERVRVSAQLIDAISGGHRWADSFDRTLGDVFAVQDEIARSVAGTIMAHVSQAEAERTLLKPPKNWRAYDYYIRAAEIYAAQFHRHFQADVIYETRRMLDRCLAMDPHFARAHVLYSATRTSSWALKLDSDYLDPKALTLAQQSAEAAVRLDSNLPQAHAQLAYVLCFKGLRDVAVAHVDRAMSLNANYSDWRFLPVLIFTGHPDRAVEAAAAHLRIDPFALPIVRGFLGLAYIFLGKYSEAVAPLSEFVSRSPNHRPGRVWLTVAYSHRGDIEAAKAQAIELLRIDPNLEETKVAHEAMHEAMRPEDAELLTEGLRKAGLQI